MDINICIVVLGIKFCSCFYFLEVLLEFSHQAIGLKDKNFRVTSNDRGGKSF